MDILFLARGVRAGRYLPFHTLGPVGCQELITLPESELRYLSTPGGKKTGPSARLLPPNGTALMMGAFMFYSRSWTGRAATSLGEPYVCSSEYFEPTEATSSSPTFGMAGHGAGGKAAAAKEHQHATKEKPAGRGARGVDAAWI